MKKTAIPYYLSSINSLLYGFENWYHIPLLGFTHPLKFTVKKKGSYYVDNFMDIWTLKEVLIDDCYGLSKEKYPKLVIDIGAGIGDFSLASAIKSKHVISCEYNPNRLSLLKRNIKLSKTKNITIIPRKIRTLDSIISSKISVCDVLKIDCEGSEYPILLNSKGATLKKIKKIIGELHFFNQDMKDDYLLLKNKLTKCGFKFHTWDNPVHSSICYFYASK